MKTVKFEQASCTLWTEGTPSYNGRPSATIGRFHCADLKSGIGLIDLALATLKQCGVSYVIGPMDGNTWQSYRFVIGGDESPPFYMEPTNPKFYPDVFRDRGFNIIGDYSSSRVEHHSPRRSDRYRTRIKAAGIRVRPFVLENAEDELRRIHALSLETFSNNFLYTPISETEFLDMYRPFVDHLNPQLIFLAEDAARVLRGFLFAIPNFAQGRSPNELIIKTYASQIRGLGGYLADLAHAQARQAGFKAVIHALMYDDNVSKQNSRKTGGQTFRRYGLFGREVGP